MIRMALGKKTFSYHKLTFKKLVLTKLHINLMPKKHIVTRNLETVLPLGVKDDGEGLDYFITPADEIDITSVSPEHAKDLLRLLLAALITQKNCRLIN